MMPARRIGNFAVRTDPPSVAAFRGALGCVGREDPTPPFTFPIVWLNAPAVRAAIGQHLSQRQGKSGAVLMHLTQEIRYHTQLAPDTDYCLTVDIAVDAAQAQLTLEALVTDATQRAICRLESRIALVWPEPKA